MNTKNSFCEKGRQEAGETVCQLSPEAGVGAHQVLRRRGGRSPDGAPCMWAHVWGRRVPSPHREQRKGPGRPGGFWMNPGKYGPFSTIEADLCDSEALSGRIYMNQRNLCSRKITLWFLKCTWAGFLDCPLSFHPFCRHSYDISVSPCYVPGTRLPRGQTLRLL